MALKRYMFVEDFPKTEEEAQKEPESPKAKATKEFGVRMLHQIAKCEWEEHEDEETGNKWVTVKKGEVGGWIEKYENLTQEGECWVHPNAIVCMDAVVSDDAQIESGEVGDASQVMDAAVVRGNAVIKERARIYGDAIIEDDSKIGGSARVKAVVQGKSEIKGNAFLFSYESLEQNKALAEREGYTGNEGFIEGSESGAVVIDSKIDGDCQLRGVFYIKKAELHDHTMVYGSGRYANKTNGKTMMVYTGWVERSKVYGKSMITGQLIGAETVEDATIKGCGGKKTDGVLYDYIHTSSCANPDYGYLLYCLENFR